MKPPEIGFVPYYTASSFIDNGKNSWDDQKSVRERNLKGREMGRKRVTSPPKKSKGVNYNVIFTILILGTIVALWILTNEPSSADVTTNGLN